eukprot:TRINITY_DN23938_c0_g1_i2.p2 TRINITY_DN23938_c0_g1~~TRINITY_DN23938_c0_g1_i2.p2  ORF type:complete len:123 (-),score=42.11 TRINITY_DN23938_c0_g1_i2:142-510(-)
MIRRPPRSTHCISSAASDVYKRQVSTQSTWDKQNKKQSQTHKKNMDIKKVSSQKKNKFSHTKFYRLFSKIKSYVLPSSIKERKNRITQYKDIGLFVASVSLLIVLQKQVRKLLSIEQSKVAN